MNRYKDEGKVLRLYDNSFNGLCALYNDDVHVTASHIWNCDLDEYNADFASRVLIGTPITVVTLVLCIKRKSQNDNRMGKPCKKKSKNY